jgi:hypothetical protein
LSSIRLSRVLRLRRRSAGGDQRDNFRNGSTNPEDAIQTSDVERVQCFLACRNQPDGAAAIPHDTQGVDYETEHRGTQQVDGINVNDVELVPLREMPTEAFLPSKRLVVIKPERKSRNHGLSV